MAPMCDIPGFITPTEAAAKLGVSHSQITRYVADNKLPAKRVGRQILIPEVSVLNFERPPKGNPNFRKKDAD